MISESIRQHFGHVIDALRGMDASSVQMIATSPPYFGLRDYGLKPVIWEPVVYAPMPGLPPLPFPAHADLNAFATCEHEWGAWTERKDIREETRHGKTRTMDRHYGAASRRFDGNHQKHAHGQFCRKCGAWRGCLGLEGDPNLYIGHLVQVFREARRVLADDGVCWLNLGDSYARNGGTDVKTPPTAVVGNTRGTLDQIGSRKQRPPNGLKSKDLVGIPWRAALALQADGWYLRSDIVWAKGASFAEDWHGNPMPESVTDRPTRAHEMIFLLSKTDRYFYDQHAAKEPAVQSATGRAVYFKRDDDNKRAQAIPGQQVGTHRESRPDVAYNQATRNIRDVWAVNTKPYKGAHFAVWPEDLVRPMILAGTSEAGHCPACGKRWRREVARRNDVRDTGAAIGGDPARNDGGTRERASPGSGGGNVLAARRIGTSQWHSTCVCNAEPVPDVVLDLFGGSGTTAQVALAHGRHAVLIDANPAYGALQASRIARSVAPAPSRHHRPRVEAPSWQMRMLFDIEAVE